MDWRKMGECAGKERSGCGSEELERRAEVVAQVQRLCAVPLRRRYLNRRQKPLSSARGEQFVFPEQSRDFWNHYFDETVWRVLLEASRNF